MTDSMGMWFTSLLVVDDKYQAGIDVECAAKTDDWSKASKKERRTKASKKERRTITIMALVGQVATVAQLVGVDAFSLITMIAEAAQTARRNRAVCRQLARRVEMIGGLLRWLRDDDARLLQHAETRGPVEALEETLRRAYLLVRSCQRRGYAFRCLMGARHADELREMQGEIGFYLGLFPLISYVDWARRRGNGKAACGDTRSLQEAPMVRLPCLVPFLFLSLLRWMQLFREYVMPLVCMHLLCLSPYVY